MKQILFLSNSNLSNLQAEVNANLQNMQKRGEYIIKITLVDSPQIFMCAIEYIDSTIKH
jgi:hypothetical protein